MCPLRQSATESLARRIGPEKDNNVLTQTIESCFSFCSSWSLSHDQSKAFCVSSSSYSVPHDRLAVSLRVQNDSLLVNCVAINNNIVFGGKDLLGRRKMICLSVVIGQASQ